MRFASDEQRKAVMARLRREWGRVRRSPHTKTLATAGAAAVGAYGLMRVAGRGRLRSAKAVMELRRQHRFLVGRTYGYTPLHIKKVPGVSQQVTVTFNKGLPTEYVKKDVLVHPSLKAEIERRTSAIHEVVRQKEAANTAAVWWKRVHGFGGTLLGARTKKRTGWAPRVGVIPAAAGVKIGLDIREQKRMKHYRVKRNFTDTVNVVKVKVVNRRRV